MARARSSGRRADYQWTLGSFVTQGLAAGASAQFAVISAGVISSTITRTRGRWFAELNGTAVAGDIVLVGVGLIKVSEGGTTTSLPLTDGDAPFFWTAQVHLSVIDSSATIDRALLGSFREVVDSKAMRVLRPDEDVVCVIETADVVGAPVVNAGFVGRFLLAR